MRLRERLERLERSARQTSPAPVADIDALRAAIMSKAAAAAIGKSGPPVDLPPEMAAHRQRLIDRIAGGQS